MTAPIEGGAEVAKIAAQFQLALTQVGIATIVDAIRLWRRMPPTKAAELADEWLEDAVRLVMTRRRLSRDLAMSYFRLARALRTGTTIPDPYNPIPTTVTLAELREEFALLTEQARNPSGEAPEPVTPALPTEGTPDTPAVAQEPSEGDDIVIPIERIKGSDEELEEDERLDAEAEQEARVVLKALGPRNLQKRVEEIDPERPAREVDELRDEAHNKAGSRQAAAADRIVKNGGRGKLWSLADRDPRVLGYVRVSQTGTPCGWCAMLISRGVIFYESERSATYGEDGDLYHDNCNCIAFPVYSKTEYNTDDIYALNREYDDLWPKVTKGLSGKAAVSAWRRYFRRMRKTGDSDTGEAQAA